MAAVVVAADREEEEAVASNISRHTPTHTQRRGEAGSVYREQ